jgi:hypothetical protein
MIDRETGEPRWTVGGAQSDFTLSGGVTELFDGEHQFEWLGDSILVFINGGMTAGGQSRAVEYTLDQDTGSAREAWSYWPSPSLNTTNLGDVDRLDSGHTLVTFSTSGVIHEVTEDDDVVWSLTSDLGGALSYATQLDSIDAWTD